jgi:hypothetical protein
MNTLRTLALAFAAASLSGAPAFGQGAGLSRDQVKAELAEARRNGELRTGGEANLRLRDMHPDLYPAPAAAPAPKSRQQVRAELEEARATGSLIVPGDLGLTEYELAPHRFPARARVAGKTRAEVKAELAEAKLLGDIPVGEDGRTMAEIHPHLYAAVRAAHQAALKARRTGEVATNSGAGPAAR